MDLTHSFTVPASIDQTWAAFQDIESVAACFPGAQVTSVEGDTFQGSCKVKLGPIALVYNGTGRFVEKDESAHRMVLEAKGKDKRGNGTAGANVVAQLTDVGGSTEVSVVTDLAITGKPAQFGRGVMQDVSDKLLGMFVECLKGKVGDGVAAAETPEPSPGPLPADPLPADPLPAEPLPDESLPGGAPASPAVTNPEATDPVVAPAAAAPTAAQPKQQEVEALNLGTTVLPVLAKAYWKQALVVVVVVVVVLILVL